ncbi:hypothetical protein E4U54_002911 [Claviceps lovelessii]|nr:hypothetical protein E4U54_002911 [Claviceps lovelessii]
METSDIHSQNLRNGKTSRLPGPAVHSGLKELSVSQHNARVQSAIPAPPGSKPSLKREIPQPAHQPDAKRKPLSDRAAEYPAPPPSASISSGTAGKLAIKAQSLAQASQMKEVSGAAGRGG